MTDWCLRRSLVKRGIYHCTTLFSLQMRRLCRFELMKRWTAISRAESAFVEHSSSATVAYIRKAGPSRATAGPGEKFSRDPQTFHGAPLGRKFLNFSFQNGTFWRTLCLWLTAGPLNVAGPGVANPLHHPTVSTGLQKGLCRRPNPLMTRHNFCWNRY